MARVAAAHRARGVVQRVARLHAEGALVRRDAEAHVVEEVELQLRADAQLFGHPAGAQPGEGARQRRARIHRRRAPPARVLRLTEDEERGPRGEGIAQRGRRIGPEREVRVREAAPARDVRGCAGQRVRPRREAAHPGRDAEPAPEHVGEAQRHELAAPGARERREIGAWKTIVHAPEAPPWRPRLSRGQQR